MKKITLILLIGISSHYSFGQLSIGVTGGILHSLKGSDAYNLATPYSAYKFGIEFLYTVHTHWQIRSGVESITYKFQKNNFSFTNISFDSHQYFKSQYIGIRLGLRYMFKGNKIKPFIDGSMNLLFNTSHSTYFQNRSIPTDKNPRPPSFILSPSLGAGIMMYPTKSLYLSFMASYSVQLNYMYEMYNDKNQLKKIRYNNLNTQLAIGYNF